MIEPVTPVDGPNLLANYCLSKQALWADLTIPTFGNGAHFTNGNGTYALSLAVQPGNPNTVYAGGYDWFPSTNGGTSWGSNISSADKNQQGIWFQPGSNVAAALASDNGVLWFADWVNVLTAPPTIARRNNGFRLSDVNSVSMQGTSGSSYLIASVRSAGHIQLTTTGISPGNLFWDNSLPGITFIDQNEPNL